MYIVRSWRARMIKLIQTSHVDDDDRISRVYIYKHLFHCLSNEITSFTILENIDRKIILYSMVINDDFHGSKFNLN
jgi:hypothetical protein